MEDSDYALVAPDVIFDVSFELNDSAVGVYPVWLFTQTITAAHAALLYHQHYVQLTPLLAGIVTTAEIEGSAALRLSHMSTAWLPVDRLNSYESNLPLEELVRLAYASSGIDVSVVLDATRVGLGLLINRDRATEADPPAC